ncbi:MAG: hypothetical protein Q7R95_01115 [bacterium]|nr:hypothetical protein [bacterium]
MNKIKIISATDVRNNWFEVLNWINVNRKEIWVKKHNRIIVKILPGEEPKIDNIEEIITKTKGSLANKKTYFPYQEDKNAITREKAYMKKTRLWKT